jgi:hypothetical protein
LPEPLPIRSGRLYDQSESLRSGHVPYV